MLQELQVQNVALIDTVTLRFAHGLNILTGETGAGKSILIDALGLALGDRSAGADAIRFGTDRAVVDALFDLSDAPPALLEYLEESGVSDLDEGILIASRELSRSTGKSVCRLNGRSVPLSVLRTAGEFLVDVHGQHEHQSLLQSSRHLELLDSWCGSPVDDLLIPLKTVWKELRALSAELASLNQDDRDRQRSLDLYSFQVAEIDAAGLMPGELENLLEERDRLANVEKITASAGAALAAISGEGALGALNDAAAGAEKAHHYDASLAGVVESIQAAISHAEDASLALSHYIDRLDSAPDRLETVENRFQAIKTLQKKYGETVEEILAFRDEAAAKLARIESSEERGVEITARIKALDAEAHKLSSALTAIRKERASKFSALIQSELRDVGMTATRFEVSVASRELSDSGADDIEFMISPNPGEPLRPLAKIASGGEISRVMLSLKSVLASSSAVPTMIFDEIDVGIGGRTGHIVGEKLARLGRSGQLLCITHLPQVASVPARHFAIIKSLEDGETRVDVRELNEKERVVEITRMLGGTVESGTAATHAREMLHDAAKRLSPEAHLPR